MLIGHLGQMYILFSNHISSSPHYDYLRSFWLYFDVFSALWLPFKFFLPIITLHFDITFNKIYGIEIFVI
ncbi:unnamed protein product [Ceratitis capitata]|uniref:(Mediterranean fruit fly) hypothetical protein n=1 Tax=Ceratitis capitata TaxID=7213 RepID=A0A811V6T6_CERCA|nr:unnamed protein product [Ceratitis capitata]